MRNRSPDEISQLKAIVKKMLMKIEQIQGELNTTRASCIDRSEFQQLEINLVSKLSTAIDRFGNLMQNFVTIDEKNKGNS